MKRALPRQQPNENAKTHRGDGCRLKLIPKAIVGFPAEVCESERGDGEKVSPARS
jgi:hypothetical protein